MWQDVRFALRMLVKDRWYTAVAVLALGLGIGVNNTVFTFVNAVLLRGLPYSDSHRILHVGGRNVTQTDSSFALSYLDYLDFRAQTKTFDDLAASRGGTMNISDADRVAERAAGAWISTNTFSMLGQPMLLGRDFRAEEGQPGAEAVAIIGHALWKNRYGGDPKVIGRAIRINEVPSVVIGVLPEGVKYPFNSDVWQPLRPGDAPDDPARRRNARNLFVIGRVKRGVSLTQAQAEMDAIAGRLQQQYPDTNKNIGAQVMTYTERVNGGPIKLIFLVLMASVAFVLVIACANVANLLLARSAARAREIAVRISLGATRWRVMRQLLVESVILGLISGAFGLALSIVGVRLFDMAVADVGKPYWIRFTMDSTVFGFLAAICVATGVVFGLAPALHVSRTNVNEVLKEGGRSGSAGSRARRFTSVVVVVEVALTVVVLVGAGLLVRSFLTLYSMELGIPSDALLTSSLLMAERKYPTEAERNLFQQRLLERLTSVPGLRSASLASTVPFGGGGGFRMQIDGRALVDRARAPRVTNVQISDNYFETLELTLRRGRAFGPTDGTKGAETAIVNERFAAQYFPNEDPLGKRLKLLEDERDTPWLTIVGISPTVRQSNLQDLEPDAVVYTPLRQRAPRGLAILARTSVPPGAVSDPLRQAVRDVDADQPVFNLRTMDEFLAQARWPWRVFGTMFAIFAVIALVLSAVGIYAVTAYSVAQRTQEIGVRMALGAQGAQVWWLVLRRGLIQLVIGLVLGLAGGFGISKILRTLVVQMSPADPLTFVAITTLLLMVTLAACVLPARRATRLDPVVALRAE